MVRIFTACSVSCVLYVVQRGKGIFFRQKEEALEPLAEEQVNI